MTVTATISKTLAGSAVADSLTGGSNGYNFGQTETGNTPPSKAVFMRHDGTTYINDLAVNVQAYSGTYGGDYSANADLTKLLGHGAAGYGLECDFRWDASTLFAVKTTFITGTGDTFATRITIPVESMSRNNGGTEVDAGTPVAGEIGATGDTTLGDRAHMTFRYVVPSTETQTGKRQFDIYYTFNFTT